MKVPPETVITLSFRCPACKKGTQMTGEMWSLVESTRGDGYYATDEVSIEQVCNYCDEYLVIPVHGHAK